MAAPRRRQKSLPGVVDDKKVQELEDALDSWAKTGSKLQKLRKDMGAQNEAIFELMSRHGLEQYRAEDGKTYKIGLGKKKLIVIDPDDSEADGEDDTAAG